MANWIRKIYKASTPYTEPQVTKYSGDPERSSSLGKNILTGCPVPKGQP